MMIYDLMVENDYYTEHNLNEIINYYTKKAEEYKKALEEQGAKVTIK